jgi:hypothetical protein
VKLWIPKWYRRLYRDPIQRMRVAAEYRAMAGSRHMLADLAIRNFVYSPTPDTDNLFIAGINEGRRRAALEIFDMVNVDPHALGDVTVQPPTRGADNATDG